MKLFRTLLAVALLAASTTAMAQTRKVVDRVDQRVEKVLDRQDVSYQFKSHAFLDLQGGAATSLLLYLQLALLLTVLLAKVVGIITFLMKKVFMILLMTLSTSLLESILCLT